jgi:hypothetical protein
VETTTVISVTSPAIRKLLKAQTVTFPRSRIC